MVWLQWTYASTLIFFPILFASVEGLRIRPAPSDGDPRSRCGPRRVGRVSPRPPAGLVSASTWALCARGERPAFLFRCGRGGPWPPPRLDSAPAVHRVCEAECGARLSGWMAPMSASFRSAVNLLVPYYYGSPTGRNDWGEWNFNEMSVSVGLLPWVLLPVALVARRRDTAFFGLMTLSAGALFYGAVAAWVDTGSLIISFRLAPLMVFPLCVFGAIGMDTLLTEPRRFPPWTRRGADRLHRAGGAGLPLVDGRLRHHAGTQDCWPIAISVVPRSADFVRRADAGRCPWKWFRMGVCAHRGSACEPRSARRHLQPDDRHPSALPDSARSRATPGGGIRAPGRVLMAPNLAMLYGL